MKIYSAQSRDRVYLKSYWFLFDADIWFRDSYIWEW